VLDIDGVVADVRHRLHHLQSRPKNWPAFFAAAAADPALEAGLHLAAELAATHELGWLTGRPERLRRVTTEWLVEYGLPPSPLRMRRSGDFRPAREMKLEVIRHLAGEAPIGLVVDDDPLVVEALASAGIPVLLADWVPYAEPLRTGQERDGRT